MRLKLSLEQYRRCNDSDSDAEKKQYIERVGHNLFYPLNVSQPQHVGFGRNRCIDKYATTISEIIQLIAELQVKCFFDDEESITATTTSTTLTIT
ncbi:hypothetical protein PVAND_014597 [Polypedilum vanderplanki]|uniref:Uncharacterized protein n=1 Tax=Polypedilum vanderplanki TaxID=319348 RepID=A0A9J6BAN5_POLVA|nr:hypothetical protein PVAND_014597 [Polypedilum vanderplanki]